MTCLPRPFPSFAPSIIPGKSNNYNVNEEMWNKQGINIIRISRIYYIVINIYRIQLAESNFPNYFEKTEQIKQFKYMAENTEKFKLY